MTEAGEATLTEALNMKIADMYRSVIEDEMRSMLAEQYPLAAISLELVPEQMQKEAALRVMEKKGAGRAFGKEYPELARMEDTVRANFEIFASEVFSALERMRTEIERTCLSGRDYGQVIALRMPERFTVRTRPGSRMTLLLETEGGSIFFKPHVCKTEFLYGRLTQRFFPELYTGNRTVVDDRASFEAPVAKLPLSSEEDARAYYTRMGLLSAIFFALNSQDMHRGNILPHGSIPVPIDLEHMMVWVMPGSELLPVIEMAMRPEQPETDSVAPPLFADTGTTHRKSDVDFNGNLPRLRDRMVTVEGYEDAFIAGFADGFRRIMENAEELIRILEAAADTPVRAVLRPHTVYPKIIRGMLEPERLRSSAVLNAWLEKIWSPLPEPERKLYRDLERDVLLSLDYPDFYMAIGERTLYRPDGTIAVRDWSHAPLDCAKARIKLFSKELLTECTDRLRMDLWRGRH